MAKVTDTGWIKNILDMVGSGSGAGVSAIYIVNENNLSDMQQLEPNAQVGDLLVEKQTDNGAEYELLDLLEVIPEQCGVVTKPQVTRLINNNFITADDVRQIVSESLQSFIPSRGYGSVRYICKNYNELFPYNQGMVTEDRRFSSYYFWFAYDLNGLVYGRDSSGYPAVYDYNNASVTRLADSSGDITSVTPNGERFITNYGKIYDKQDDGSYQQVASVDYFSSYPHATFLNSCGDKILMFDNYDEKKCRYYHFTSTNATSPDYYDINLPFKLHAVSVVNWNIFEFYGLTTYDTDGNSTGRFLIHKFYINKETYQIDRYELVVDTGMQAGFTGIYYYYMRFLTVSSDEKMMAFYTNPDGGDETLRLCISVYNEEIGEWETSVLARNHEEYVYSTLFVPDNFLYANCNDYTKIAIYKINTSPYIPCYAEREAVDNYSYQHSEPILLADYTTFNNEAVDKFVIRTSSQIVNITTDADNPVVNSINVSDNVFSLSSSNGIVLYTTQNTLHKLDSNTLQEIEALAYNNISNAVKFDNGYTIIKDSYVAEHYDDNNNLIHTTTSNRMLIPATERIEYGILFDGTTLGFDMYLDGNYQSSGSINVDSGSILTYHYIKGDKGIFSFENNGSYYTLFICLNDISNITIVERIDSQYNIGLLKYNYTWTNVAMINNDTIELKSLV